MPQPILIPGYDRSAWHDDTYPGVLFDLPMEKGVLHSTEGVSLPTYGPGGTDAPNVTLDPWRRLRWQHHPLNAASRALVNPASTQVSENRDRVWQVEIIGCSDTKWAAKIGRPDRDLDRLTDDDYDWLGEQIALMCDLTGVPPTLTTSRPWLRYPASYGNSAARMSGPEYNAYRGILGHMHVSGNLHGDPKIDRDRMQAAVTRHSAASDPEVAAEQAALNAALAGWPGYVPITVDGVDGDRTALARSQYMATLESLAKQLARIEKQNDDILESLIIPLNAEGRRVFGSDRDSITTGQALAGMGLAARRSEVVLAIAEAEATEAMRKWASDGGPKPGLDRPKGVDQ